MPGGGTVGSPWTSAATDSLSRDLQLRFKLDGQRRPRRRHVGLEKRLFPVGPQALEGQKSHLVIGIFLSAQPSS